jgi:G:T-mismatch repair DNA endonuclease (very short patch repair protein)
VLRREVSLRITLGLTHKSPIEVHPFWIPKLESNAARDERDIAALEADGWDVLVVWECQATPRHRDNLMRWISEFLG